MCVHMYAVIVYQNVCACEGKRKSAIGKNWKKETGVEEKRWWSLAFDGSNDQVDLCKAELDNGKEARGRRKSFRGREEEGGISMARWGANDNKLRAIMTKDIDQ